MLGMAIDVWSRGGLDRCRPASGAGELVCTAPFPSMPLGFWGDGPLGQVGPRYRDAYFERFPGAWCQGDFASWTEHGGIVIHGRSDATLNPGGVRIGTADLYRLVERQPEVAEALVFGQQWDGDVRIVLAVRLQPDVALGRRAGRQDAAAPSGASCRPATCPRSSSPSTTCPAPAAASWSSWPWPTPSTAGRCATGRPSPTRRPSTPSPPGPSSSR